MPRNNLAVTQWRNRDEAFLDVVIDIWVIIRDMHKERYPGVGYDRRYQFFSRTSSFKMVDLVESPNTSPIGIQLSSTNTSLLHEAKKYKTRRQLKLLGVYETPLSDDEVKYMFPDIDALEDFMRGY